MLADHCADMSTVRIFAKAYMTAELRAAINGLEEDKQSVVSSTASLVVLDAILKGANHCSLFSTGLKSPMNVPASLLVGHSGRFPSDATNVALHCVNTNNPARMC